MCLRCEPALPLAFQPYLLPCGVSHMPPSSVLPTCWSCRLAAAGPDAKPRPATLLSRTRCSGWAPSTNGEWRWQQQRHGLQRSTTQQRSGSAWRQRQQGSRRAPSSSYVQQRSKQQQLKRRRKKRWHWSEHGMQLNWLACASKRQQRWLVSRWAGLAKGGSAPRQRFHVGRALQHSPAFPPPLRPSLPPHLQAECAAALAEQERQQQELLSELRALKACLPSAAPSRAGMRLEGLLPAGLPLAAAATAAARGQQKPAATAPGQLMELLSDEEEEQQQRQRQPAPYPAAAAWEQPRRGPPLPLSRRGFC